MSFLLFIAVVSLFLRRFSSRTGFQTSFRYSWQTRKNYVLHQPIVSQRLTRLSPLLWRRIKQHLGLSKKIPIQIPILDRLGQMFGRDAVGAGQVRDRAAELEDLAVAPGAEI